MNRRNLIKTLGLSAIGLATVPLWIDSWTPESLPETESGATPEQKLVLKDLMDIIIPATDTPGARDLEVDRFILTMVADCYEKEAQDKFFAGFDQLNASAKVRYSLEFSDLEDVQKLELSEEILSGTTQDELGYKFLSFVKGLTIAGYMNSQYVMENITKYEFVPTRFNGSFKVDQNPSKNSVA